MHCSYYIFLIVFNLISFIGSLVISYQVLQSHSFPLLPYMSVLNLCNPPHKNKIIIMKKIECFFFSGQWSASPSTTVFFCTSHSYPTTRFTHHVPLCSSVFPASPIISHSDIRSYNVSCSTLNSSAGKCSFQWVRPLVFTTSSILDPYRESSRISCCYPESWKSCNNGCTGLSLSYTPATHRWCRCPKATIINCVLYIF